MSIIVVIVSIDDFEKNFIDSWIFCVECKVPPRTKGRAMISFHFFVLWISFDTSDDVYKNRVIIPDEKVRIRM